MQMIQESEVKAVSALNFVNSNTWTLSVQRLAVQQMNTR
jgi:hypothetical protein